MVQMLRNIVFILLLTLLIQNIYAADWFTISGNRARVEYQHPYEALADSLLNIAENELPRLAAFHGLELSELDKQQVRIILTDVPDISNGMALGNSVLIYARSSMYMPSWTGTDSWYQTVLTHELAHYVTFLKIRRRLNFLGQAFNLTIPRWFFEGIAQYFAEDWTAYRGDLYIENALLAGKLNYTNLENLEDGRLLYATGHAFVRYLAAEHGDSSLIRVMSYKEKGWYLDFDKAFKSVYGKKPAQKFSDFTRLMVLHYGSKLADYPEKKLLDALPAFGYKDFQVLNVSVSDSTWLVSTQWDKNHRYKSAIFVRQNKNGFEKISKISSHFSTDVILNSTNTLAAYGRYHVNNSENQLHLGMDWFIYDFQSEKTKIIAGDVRARSASFTTDNHLILAEIMPAETRLMCYDLIGGSKTIQQSQMPVGRFIVQKDASLIASVQQKNGNRDLFHFKDGQEIPLTNDQTDDRNPLLLNDSILIYNRYQNGRPAIASLNLRDASKRMVLNDRYPYYLEGLTADSTSVILSRWGASREKQFILMDTDSLLKSKTPDAIQLAHPELADWTRLSPKTRKSTATDSVTKTVRKVILPYFPMEHLLSFALPTQDPANGWGLYGVTSWIEAMQRQALAAVFLLYPDYDKSLVTVQHLLKAFNGQFLTTYYHGPVIFGFEDGRYLHLLQDIAVIDWQYQWYLKGNPRTRIGSSISYSHYAHKSSKTSFTDYSYHGPTLRISFNYLLPTKAYPALPKRQFTLSTEYFKSLKNQNDFSILGLSLKLATNLIREDLGIKVNSVYLKQQGTLPSYKSVGVDRFYEFDLPRDYIFSRTIRGLRADLSGKELFWNSTELVYLIDEYTPYKLIILPVTNLTFSTFLDFAEIKGNEDYRAYSWGGEMSFGEDGLRFGFGYARVKDHLKHFSTQYYGRISLIMP